MTVAGPGHDAPITDEMEWHSPIVLLRVFHSASVSRD